MVMVKSSSVDLVTQTDQKVEQLIIQSVKEKFPTHRLAPPPSGNSSQMRGGCFIMCVCVCVRFIGEESVAAGEPCVLSDEPTWIIDPIDGTTNFVHR